LLNIRLRMYLAVRAKPEKNVVAIIPTGIVALLSRNKDSQE
jgi:hypothetical protein